MRLFGRDNIYRPSEQINNYIIKKVIGEGRFGICYEVIKGKRQYILKQLKSKALRKDKTKVCYEEETLKELKHDAIPGFVEKIENEDFFGYILEFKAGKTLEDIIYCDGYIFYKEEILLIGSQLVEILKYLHSRNIVHRDIRIPNILYDGQNIKLIDFGLARWINNEKYKADIDFAFFGDFLLHLYYTAFQTNKMKKCPWYEELEISESERVFLKRLMGIEPRYRDISEVEYDFLKLLDKCG